MLGPPKKKASMIVLPDIFSFHLWVTNNFKTADDLKWPNGV